MRQACPRRATPRQKPDPSCFNVTLEASNVSFKASNVPFKASNVPLKASNGRRADRTARWSLPRHVQVIGRLVEAVERLVEAIQRAEGGVWPLPGGLPGRGGVAESGRPHGEISDGVVSAGPAVCESPAAIAEIGWIRPSASVRIGVLLVAAGRGVSQGGDRGSSTQNLGQQTSRSWRG